MVSKAKTKKKKRIVRRKKRKLEEQVHKIVEQEQPPIEEAEPKTTLPEEELKQITQEPEKKPSEKTEVPPPEVKYIATDEEEETDKQGYVKHEIKKGKKPSYGEQIKTEHAGEPGYTDPAAIKAGLPRKGYIESKGLLKDPMLEELRKKHEEDTKKEYQERHKKMYGKKEEK